MRRYLIRRFFQLIPLLIGISLISFVIMRLAPGDPAAIFVDPDKPASLEQLAAIRHDLGLDRPIYVQYLLWLKGVMRGNWGYSFASHQSVLSGIIERLPNTLALGGVAMALALLVAIPIGILSALRPYSVLDYTVTLLALLGVSIPAFWFGLALMQIFANGLGWLPAVGMHSIGVEPGTLEYVIDTLKHFIMPSLVLAVSPMASWTRYQRSSMLDVIRQNYIQTARAKGLPERVVIYRHALKNSFIPVLTVIGMSIPNLVGGAYVTETIFGWPGMGRLGVTAIFRRDYPVVMGVTMLSAVIIVVVNVLTDLAYFWLDPRIQFE